MKRVQMPQFYELIASIFYTQTLYLSIKSILIFFLPNASFAQLHTHIEYHNSTKQTDFFPYILHTITAPTKACFAKLRTKPDRSTIIILFWIAN